MAQPLSKEVLDTAVNPAAVREQSFVIARRGFSQRQVHEYLDSVADALLDAQTRESDMRRRLGKAVRRAESVEQKLRNIAPAETDETARQIGDEVATVLEAARVAADQNIAAAKEEADSIVAAAKAASTKMRQATGAELAATKSELLSESQAEAEAMREQARTDSDEMLAAAAVRVEQARTEGDNLIQEASEARAQILEDMERRRRKARVQVERLRVGRDRLLRSYELVRRTLDETTGELKISLKEAKVRGDGAARAVASQPLATREELEEELLGSQLIGRFAALPRPLSDAIDAEQSQAPQSRQSPQSKPKPRKPVVADAKRSTLPAQPKAPAFAPVLTPAPTDAHDLATTAAQADTAAPVSAQSAPEEAQRSDNALRSDTADDAEIVDITDEAIAAELAALSDDDLNVIEPSDEIEEVLAIAVDAPTETEEAAETADEAEGRAAEDAAPESGLFAALRAQRGGAAAKKRASKEAAAKKSAKAGKAGKQAKAAKAAKAGKAGKQAKAAGADQPAPDEQVPVDSGDDQVDEPLAAGPAVETVRVPAATDSRFPGIAAQRDAVIADAAKQLEKRLKRALADEQNELLAGLRKGTGKGKRKKHVALAGLVGDPDKQLSRYVAAINEVAAVTYGAGAALIDAEAEQGRLPAGAVEELLVADVVSPIRDQLETLDRLEVASSDMHVDPVRSFYRQRKTDHLGDAAARLAHLLCVAGVCDALPAKAPLPWEATTK